MAVVTPRTWVVGEVVTAAYMNAEIRDQFTPLVGLFACTQVVNSAFTVPNHASNYSAVTYTGISSSNNTSMWNISNASRLVAPRAGTYIVHGGASWPSGLAAFDARMEFRLNGSGTATATARLATQRGSSGNCQNVASGVLIFTAAAQYAEIYANQNSGANRDINVTMGMTCVSQATS